MDLLPVDPNPVSGRDGAARSTHTHSTRGTSTCLVSPDSLPLAMRCAPMQQRETCHSEVIVSQITVSQMTANRKGQNWGSLTSVPLALRALACILLKWIWLRALVWTSSSSPTQPETCKTRWTDHCGPRAVLPKHLTFALWTYTLSGTIVAQSRRHSRSRMLSRFAITHDIPYLLQLMHEASHFVEWQIIGLGVGLSYHAFAWIFRRIRFMRRGQGNRCCSVLLLWLLMCLWAHCHNMFVDNSALHLQLVLFLLPLFLAMLLFLLDMLLIFFLVL